MPMYNIIEYRDNYINISGNLRQYYRDVVDFTSANHNSKSFK